jgi:hypothetical protein
VKRDGPKNIVASVQARLVDRSRELDVEHQLTLARFGGERPLYRLSKAEFADRSILKGAALLLRSIEVTTTIQPPPNSCTNQSASASGLDGSATSRRTRVRRNREYGRRV